MVMAPKYAVTTTSCSKLIVLLKQQNYLLQPHFRQIKEITLADGWLVYRVISDDTVGLFECWRKKGNSRNIQKILTPKKRLRHLNFKASLHFSHFVVMSCPMKSFCYHDLQNIQWNIILTLAFNRDQDHTFQIKFKLWLFD